jgi:hypothetical protein
METPPASPRGSPVGASKKRSSRVTPEQMAALPIRNYTRRRDWNTSGDNELVHKSAFRAMAAEVRKCLLDKRVCFTPAVHHPAHDFTRRLIVLHRQWRHISKPNTPPGPQTGKRGRDSGLRLKWYHTPFLNRLVTVDYTKQQTNWWRNIESGMDELTKLRHRADARTRANRVGAKPPGPVRQETQSIYVTPLSAAGLARSNLRQPLPLGADRYRALLQLRRPDLLLTYSFYSGNISRPPDVPISWPGRLRPDAVLGFEASMLKPTWEHDVVHYPGSRDVFFPFYVEVYHRLVVSFLLSEEQ